MSISRLTSQHEFRHQLLEAAENATWKVQSSMPSYRMVNAEVEVKADLAQPRSTEWVSLRATIDFVRAHVLREAEVQPEDGTLT